MSTPIPPNCKLEGLELYAPKRARTQAARETEEAPHPEEELALASADAGAPFESLPQDEPPDLTPAEDARFPEPTVQSAARHLRLEPEIVPEPRNLSWQPVDLAALSRYALVIGAAAIAAYGVTLISNSQSAGPWHERTGKSFAAVEPAVQAAAAALRPAPRLAVEDRQTFANEPLSLGVSVESTSGHESVLLAGLERGTRLSAGAPVGVSGWQIATRDLDDVVVYAPKDFVGVMDTAIDLLAPNERLMDSSAMRLQWIARSFDAKEQTPAADLATVEKAAVQPMDAGEAARLMQHGEDLLKIGDIAAARLAFRHLADAGNAAAAFALAVTFDPRYLALHNVVGMTGDEARARTWYQRAKQLGSAEAARMLDQMAAQ